MPSVITDIKSMDNGIKVSFISLGKTHSVLVKNIVDTTSNFNTARFFGASSPKADYAYCANLLCSKEFCAEDNDFYKIIKGSIKGEYYLEIGATKDDDIKK